MKQKLTMSARLYLSNLFLILVAVLLTGGLCLRVTLTNKQRDMDAAISDIANVVAGMDAVRQALEDGHISSDLLVHPDRIVADMEYVDILVICDTTSSRLYHNNEDRVGEIFVGGDEGSILQGAEPYISVAEGTLGLQRRAFHAVTDSDGTIIGFVMVSVLNDHLTEIRSQILLVFLGIAAVLLLLGLPPEARTDGEPLVKLFPQTRLPNVLHSGARYLQANDQLRLVGSFANGQDALSYLQNHPVDLS